MFVQNASLCQNPQQCGQATHGSAWQYTLNLSEENGTKWAELTSSFEDKREGLMRERDEAVARAKESGMDSNSIDRMVKEYDNRLDAMLEEQQASLVQFVNSLDASEVVQNKTTHGHLPDGFRAHRSGEETEPARVREEQASKSKKSFTTHTGGKKPKKADKSGFVPLWQDNPSMRNTIEKKSDEGLTAGRGKLDALISQLEEQKEYIQEQKSALVERTLKNGGDLDQIKEPLMAYEEQIEEINGHISELLARQTQQLAEKVKNKAAEEKSMKEAGPSESGEDARIFELSDLTAQMGKSDIMMKAKARVEGEGNIAISQLKLDQFRTDATIMRRKAESALSGEPISSPEMRSLYSARKAYSKQIRQVEQETLAASNRLNDMAAQNTGEVLGALRPVEPQEAEETERSGAEQEEQPAG